jgi:hypothetical protein
MILPTVQNNFKGKRDVQKPTTAKTMAFMAFGHVGLGCGPNGLGHFFCHLHVCCTSGIIDAAVDDETPAHDASNRPEKLIPFFQTTTPSASEMHLLNSGPDKPILNTDPPRAERFIEIPAGMCF